MFWGQYVPYSVHQQLTHSLFPLGVMGLVLPNLSLHDTFVGLAVLTLALVGLARCFEVAEVRLLGAIGVGGLLLALGGFSVFHGLAYLLVPMVEKARSPAMTLVLVQFALTVLAAYGLDTLRRGDFGRWPVRALLAIGILPWPVLALVASVRSETLLSMSVWRFSRLLRFRWPRSYTAGAHGTFRKPPRLVSYSSWSCLNWEQ